MIISHKHKYVFVELPQTASSAIAKELKANYDGHEILFKQSPLYLKHSRESINQNRRRQEKHHPNWKKQQPI